MRNMTEYRFVDHLPDLISPAEYAGDPEGRTVRLRIRVTADGVEILGDSAQARAVEELLEELGVKVIDQMLCG